MSNFFWRFLLVFALFMACGCTRSVSQQPVGLLPTLTQAPSRTSQVSLPTSTPSPVAPLPSPSATTTSTEVWITYSAKIYAVAFLGEDDLLNVRVSPGLSSEVIQTLDPSTRGLRATGKQEELDGQTWLEFQLEGDLTGWISSRFVTEQVEAEDFCHDPRVDDLIKDLHQALEKRDGKLLSKLVSPKHGLTIHHNWWNPAVNIASPEAVENLFISTTDYNWGTEDGSGLPIDGPFKDKILPKLLDVFQSDYTLHCNILETGVSAGGTAGLLNWPVEYSNLNYMVVFRPPPSVEDELNWRTWAVGVEYVNGVPYLAVLVQYYWEI